MTDFQIHLLLGLLPVSCFLAGLVYMDSYKLVSIRRILAAIAAGCVLAAVSYPINSFGLESIGFEFLTYTRYVAPFVEEALKAFVIILLMRHNRIGFLVDAAIYGFAVGAGFAILENLFYLNALPDMGLGTWVVRGFGTAIMHGGATAIFAVIAHSMLSQQRTSRIATVVPAFLAAAVVHSVFNHFFLAPIINTAVVLVSLPLLLMLVFNRSERSMSDWLGMGFDADAELLELINSGEFSGSKVGRYLHSLKEKFAGPVVADLLCYLRLHTELSIRAKGLLLMRESGFKNKAGAETRAKLEELRYLEQSIGATGKLAIKPFLQMGEKDLWQFYMLEK